MLTKLTIYWMQVILALFVLCILSSASVLAAVWIPVSPKLTWNLQTQDFCPTINQCLVHPQGTTTIDGQPAAYINSFDRNNNQNLAVTPRCINSGQYILDYYCENGQWTSRTKYLASVLARVGETANPENYSLFCDNVTNSVNALDYQIGNVLIPSIMGTTCKLGSSRDWPCVNTICTLTYGNKKALGFSMNAPITDTATSTLLALGKNPDICRETSTNSLTDNDFDPCEGRLGMWYHDGLNLLVYLKDEPNRELNAPLDIQGTFETLFSNSLLIMKTAIHDSFDRGNTFQTNMSIFTQLNLYNVLFYTVRPRGSMIGFQERNVYDAHIPINALGFFSTGFNFTQTPCESFIKTKDNFAHCTQLAQNQLVIARKKTSVPFDQSSLPALWNDLTAKLRP